MKSTGTRSPHVRQTAGPQHSGTRGLLWCLALALLPVGPTALAGQVEATPVLDGTVFVGDEVMNLGTVVLHHLADGTQGQLDSVAVGSDGTFVFALPNVPDPARGDMFFGSVRHHGVLYFGPAITTAVQLDSTYQIQTFDTLLAPSQGLPLTLQARSVFFEPDSAGWGVTDLFQVRNDESRTIVARPEGRVWSHPLPAEAREVTVGEGEVVLDAASFEQGSLVVRAALSPGERLFVVRYRLDSPIVEIPNRGVTEALDVLIREPAPPLDVEGLELLDRVELEAGTTYMRFTGADVAAPSVRVVETEPERALDTKWIAVILTMVLAGGGVVALRPKGAAPQQQTMDRRSLLAQVARMDEDFESSESTPAARREYQKRRAELIREIRSVS